jgi:beta-lactamase regulating signal transducer with metallopeptidase domain
MIVWMLYSVLVALIVAAAARAADWLARLAGYSVRWVWAGALTLTVFLSASALLHGVAPASLATEGSQAIDLSDAVRTRGDASWGHALRVRIEQVRRSLDAPLLAGVVSVRRTVSPAANVYAASLSLVISLGVVALLVGVARRFRSARREWPLVTMQGVDVRVAPTIGPVVIGLVRPEIIVPRWLLGRQVDEQRLVVTHEDEHVRARDPLLLGLAWSAVVVAPWNPAVWYMLSRLRLAVELDCDARVLRRGAAPRSYGSLLIDVAQHASALRLSALALADDSTHLQQRILAMKPIIPRFARLRGGLAATFAFTGVLVACQATLPTDAEIERMDVASATRAAHELAKVTHDDTTVAYTLDGKNATLSEVSALPSKTVGKVDIVIARDGNPTKINVATLKRKMIAAASDTDPVRRGRGGQVDAVLAAPSPDASKTAFTGLIFIDGVRATEAQMKTLDRAQIESVEVIKGPFAAALYKEPEAANGVITIKTKRGGAN